MPIEIGQGDLAGGVFKPHHVAVGPEHPYFAFLIAVGLEPLVALHSVVQGRVEGVKHQVLEGLDFRFVPHSILGCYG